MNTESTAQFAGVTIVLREESASEFVEGVADLSETNVQASYDAYLEALREAVAAEYPGAVVDTSRHDGYADTVSVARTVDDADEVEERIYSDLFSGMRLHEIAREIQERGDFWISCERLREHGVYTFEAYSETHTVVAGAAAADGSRDLYTLAEWREHDDAESSVYPSGALNVRGDRGASTLRVEDMTDTGLTEVDE